MGIQKIAVSAVMLGAMGAAGLGLAGSASASPFHYTPPKPPTIKVQAQKTVVRDNGQVGNGNTQQTASGNAGAISNPQLGVAANVGLQVPLQVGANVLTSRTGGADQDATQRQSATGNVSNNSTVVNNSTDNGNHSSTSIGSQG